MGHGLYAVAILNGGSNGHSAGAFEGAYASQRAVGLLAIDIFAMVRCDVDLLRIELAQAVDYREHFVDAVAFERW